MANVKVFEADLGKVVSSINGPLSRAQGLSGRAIGRINTRVRTELRNVLHQMLIRAYADGSAPSRSGKSKRIMLNGIRTFGSRSSGIRGHIIGPDYIAAHNEGATITPKKAKALAIPIGAALRPDGTPKLNGPRSWQNIVKTFIFKSRKTGQGYIAYRNGAGGVTLLYVLVDQAVLRQHSGFLDRAWNLNKFSVMQEFGEAVQFEFAQVNLRDLARVTSRR
jgi:hypothetical protein